MSVIVAERFDSPKPVIGLVSLLSIKKPGEPGQLARLLDRVEQETLAWLSAGVDGLLVENTRQPVTPIPDFLLSVMTLAVQKVVRLSAKPVGVSVLPNHPELANTLAWVTGAQWIRQPVAMGCRVNPNGLLSANVLETPYMVVSDVTPDHWLPDGANTLPQMLAVMPGDALLVPARYLREAMANTLSNPTTPSPAQKPLWVLDDGSPPDVEALSRINGIILGPSVLREDVAAGQSASYYNAPSIDPLKAQRWVQAFKAS